jgi:hypothetical protein
MICVGGDQFIAIKCEVQRHGTRYQKFYPSGEGYIMKPGIAAAKKSP